MRSFNWNTAEMADLVNIFATKSFWPKLLNQHEIAGLIQYEYAEQRCLIASKYM